MNFEEINKKEEKDIFAAGIDIDDPQVIEGFDDMDKKFIRNNVDLFERFNDARSKAEASEIISAEARKGKEERETAQRMYDFVKERKRVYHS